MADPADLVKPRVDALVAAIRECVREHLGQELDKLLAERGMSIPRSGRVSRRRTLAARTAMSRVSTPPPEPTPNEVAPATEPLDANPEFYAQSGKV